ncbi:uncharacterized protein PAC_07963 [Phialocephala subalpina]|uniref:Uncharacterized protein n=1 Tax=Phialocephala subalpina TaxID=576137 RepID=A0A1L7WZ78_9HELO|nr:uncharacterized protein PAC_07963 [Phialocephala subalpina]
MASVTQLHKPQPLLQEDFRHGYLKPMSYSMEDVSKAVVNHLNVQSSEHNLTPIQKSALERYRYGGTWNLGQPNSTQNIKKFFNEVYFNGILTGFGSLELLSPENMIKRRGYTVHAFTELLMPGVEKDLRYKLKTPKAIIIIENLDANEETYRKPNIRMQSYLDTLLHEMLHAVFPILTCWCQFGCAGVHANHGFQWQAAALALEEADDSGNGLLRLGCDLDKSGIEAGRGEDLSSYKECDGSGGLWEEVE